MNQKSALPLAQFRIAGLHGDRDVTLDFTSPATIINADNGAGKTTVLNVLFRVLDGNWARLFRTVFEYVELTFAGAHPIRVDSQLFRHSKEFLQWVRNALPSRRRLSDLELQQIYLALLSVTPDRDPDEDPYVREIARKLDVPAHYLLHRFMRDEPEISQNSELRSKLESIEKHINCPLLYLPTYRRVEEDIAGVSLARESSEEQIIQFGMHDVEERISRVTSEIKESALRWSTQVNGEILTELIDEIKVDESTYEQLRNADTVRIVLDRTNRTSEKERILRLIESNQIRDPQRRPLAYFLGKLIQIYTQQKENDNAIKSFVITCNRYLRENELKYDDSKVEVTVLDKRRNTSVSFGNLSSGEKQVVSMFSKLYLDVPDKCALIIDEPELSLSIEWQRMFLPDILASDKCDFLLAATHSPFIFSNDLDSVARDMKVVFRGNGYVRS